jgi:hypothetical protein
MTAFGPTLFFFFLHLLSSGRFTLWWRRSLVKNSREILKYDWPKVRLLSGGGLHYGQESISGELCTWMKKMTWLPMWQHFFEEGFSEGQVFGQPQSLKQEAWPPENSNLNKILSKHVLFSTFQGHY